MTSASCWIRAPEWAAPAETRSPTRGRQTLTARSVIAVDLGATSGRVELIRFDGERLALEEVHRFPNAPISAGGTLYWDALGLWHEVTRGLRMAADRAGGEIAGVAVDGWGVDFALLDS